MALHVQTFKSYLHEDKPGHVFVRFDGGEGDVAYVYFTFDDFLTFVEKIVDQATKLCKVLDTE